MSDIRFRNVWKVFGRHGKEAMRLAQAGCTREQVLGRTGATVALADVSFDVHHGELFVLMGLSGCGKSTLLRTINRLVDPTAGSVAVGGVDVTRLGRRDLQAFRRKRVGMVFQHFALLPHRTVLENVAFGLELQGTAREERERKAMEALDLVRLSQWAHADVSSLSGGMRQRVGVARALAIEPDVLLMDEPFSALDPLIRSSMQRDLQLLRERLGKTIVFVTHDLDEALTLGDRIAVMREGRIVQVGGPADIATRPEDAFVEAFVEGVNKARVLRAADVMRPPVILLSPEMSPKTAIRLMDERGFETAFVANKDGSLHGVLAMGPALLAAHNREPTIARAIEAPVVASPEARVEDLLTQVLATRRPAAVVDASGRFVGVVRNRYLLPLFAQREGAAEGVEEVTASA